MKSKWTIFFLFLLAAVQWQCTKDIEGTVIRGKIANAENIQVFLDRIYFNKASMILAKSDIDGSGNFEFAFPEGIEPGVYNIRIGVKKINLAFNGSEGLVEIEGDLTELDKHAFSISGSTDALVLSNTWQELLNQRFRAEDVSNFIDTTSNAYTAAFVTYRSLPPNVEDFLTFHEKAYKRLATDFPKEESLPAYQQLIQANKAQIAARKAMERVKVGEMAPDISLPNPNGKEYSLSDLKGKVVLLDFWASWCGPCRAENPNVVNVYNRYKDKGFTVFSVSLDGVDDRMASRYTPEQMKGQMANHKQRWVSAIQKDRLSWDYHVSDLKKWSSLAAKTYGVNSIPRAFLIDREGRIASTGVRGSAQIERELQKLL